MKTSFEVGVDIFNSCDRLGSIGYFSDHLRKYPDDYNALIWRSKAYSFVGQTQNALRDTEHAIAVSSGVNREIAVARNIRASGDIEAYGCQAERTVKKYPDDWKAWMELGTFFADVKNHQEAIRCYTESLSIAIKNNETSDPDICWLNYYVGNSWLKKKDVDIAKRYYEAAIDSCSTHTPSHIQLCICNIAQGNITAAYKYFMKAKMFNQSLASQTFQTKSFKEYVSRERPRAAPVSRVAAGIQGGGAVGEATVGLVKGNDNSNDYCDNKLQRAGKPDYDTFHERPRICFVSSEEAGIQGGGAQGGATGRLVEGNYNWNDYCENNLQRAAGLGSPGQTVGVSPAQKSALAFGTRACTISCTPGFSSYTLISSETEKCTMSPGEFAAMTTGVPPIQRSEPSPLPTSFLQRDIDTQAPLEAHSKAQRLDREEIVSARSGIGLNIVEGNGLNIDELNSRFCFEEATSGPNYCWAGLNQTGYTQPFTFPCLRP